MSLTQAKELMMQEFLSNIGLNLDDLLEVHDSNSILEHLHKVGLMKELYRGSYDPNQLSLMNSASQCRYVDSTSIKADRVHRRVSTKTNGTIHLGDYIESIGKHEKPWLVKAHGARIDKSTGFFTYSPTMNLRALFFLYGEELLDYLDLTQEDQEIIMEKIGTEEMQAGLFNLVFNGQAGSARITSAKGETSTEHRLGVNQPLMIKGSRINYDDHVRLTCGCEYYTLGNFVQRENSRKYELCKHLIAFLVGIKKGSQFLIDHGHEVKSNRSGLQFCNPEDVQVSKIPVLTLYEPLEEPLINGKPNPIFKQVNSEIARSLYIECKPGYEIDFRIMNTYGELILTPLLHWDLITNSRTYDERMNHTCIKGGNVWLNGNLQYFYGEVLAPIPVADVNELTISYYATRLCKMKNSCAQCNEPLHPNTVKCPYCG